MNKIKFIFLVIAIIFIDIITSLSQPSLLFVLPGRNSFVAQKTYDIFSLFYRGRSVRISANDYSVSQSSKYDCVINIEESINSLRMVSLSIQFVHNGSRNSITKGGSLNSDLSLEDVYKLQALELAFDFLKEFDVEYFKEIQESIKDIIEEEIEDDD